MNSADLTAGAGGDHPARWRALAVLSLGQLLGMCTWFAGNAVAPQLAAAWGLDAAETGWLTSAVQLGFVVGTAASALLNLPDVVSGRTLVAVSAAGAALSNAALTVAPGFGPALASRFATGVFLAGVYPPAMKMAATWFRSGRGLAIGILIGALTLGKAVPYLVGALGHVPWPAVVWTVSAGSLVAAALIATAYHDGPFPFPRRPFSWRLAGEVARHRETRLAVGGYLGHMWELYAMWTWLPAFLAASALARGGAGEAGAGSAVAAEAAAAEAAAQAAAHFGNIQAAITIAVGAAGCLWGGWMADRIGRGRLVTIAMAASGACALAIGTLFGASPALLLPVAWAWGFFVIADSAQFSALVTEVAPPHAVGTALALQTSLGFLLTTATIQLVPAIAGRAGWPWAFPVLAVGPALGIAAIARLRVARSSPGPPLNVAPSGAAGRSVSSHLA